MAAAIAALVAAEAVSKRSGASAAERLPAEAVDQLQAALAALCLLDELVAQPLATAPQPTRRSEDRRLRVDQLAGAPPGTAEEAHEARRAANVGGPSMRLDTRDTLPAPYL